MFTYQSENEYSMKLTPSKIKEIFQNFSATLEERDLEDMQLYGWKGGIVSSYKYRKDTDDTDEDREE